MPDSIRADYRLLSPHVRFVHEVELPPGTWLPERHIFDHEFIFVVKGEGTLRIEDRTHAMKGGDLLHIRPHLANEMTISREAPMRCFAVHFDYVFLGEGLDFSPYAVYLGQRGEGAGEREAAWLNSRRTAELAEFEVPERLRPLNVQPFYEAFRQLCTHFERPEADSPLLLKAEMLRLIGLVRRELISKEGIRLGHPHADLALEAIAYMEERYAERISTAQLAKRAALSPKYFGTIFKEAAGQTVSDYLLRLRLKEAKRLLRERRYTVQEIAEKVGIGDLPYFSKLFKRMEGVSPRKYADSIAWLEGVRRGGAGESG